MDNKLKEIYVKKLGKVLSMEETIVKHLPKMVSAATNKELRAGLTNHLEETRAQCDRIRNILSGYRETREEDDEAFALMMQNADEEVEQVDDPTARDALIIASAQSVEHLEMAKYATLIEWAKQLDDTDAISLLKETLAEEKAADKVLSGVAEGGLFTTGVNEEAAHR